MQTETTQLLSYSFTWNMVLRTFCSWTKDPPVKYVAAESNRLPTGVLPTMGWLCHCLWYWHFSQSWVNATKVPICLLWSTHLVLQIGQDPNNSLRQLSKTMYFFSPELVWGSILNINKYKIVAMFIEQWCKLNWYTTVVFITYDNSDSSVAVQSGLYVELWGSTCTLVSLSSFSSSSNTRRGLLLGLNIEPVIGVEDRCTSGSMTVVSVPTSWLETVAWMPTSAKTKNTLNQ